MSILSNYLSGCSSGVERNLAKVEDPLHFLPWRSWLYYHLV